ncbi:bifunctional 2-keto-4-hydroxyglutarate aldolase/2-keto-3-deoxy-6-phosphogluconate aldolase, partial [Bacillus velezensis]|nr:bifunctional 2-keto-4-hydroxyglutarate aldolase/2-keto-3-deoxy-6-phosphogluconate aldolase [Bacillus velezensis]
EGGVKAIELTFTIPNVVQVIRKLVTEYQSDNSVIIGAGTVLDVVSAKLAIDAGAKFIVSPSFSKDVAMECNLFNIPYTP